MLTSTQLAVSDAPYLQGIAEKFDGDTSGEVLIWSLLSRVCH